MVNIGYLRVLNRKNLVCLLGFNIVKFNMIGFEQNLEVSFCLNILWQAYFHSCQFFCLQFYTKTEEQISTKSGVMGQCRTHYILAQIWINGWIQEYFYPNNIARWGWFIIFDIFNYFPGIKFMDIDENSQALYRTVSEN